MLLTSISEEDLIRAYWDLNRYQWDEDVLGKKPDNFDNLIPYNDFRPFWKRKRITKKHYCWPVMKRIESIIGEQRLSE